MRPIALTSLCLAVLLSTGTSANVIHVNRYGTPGSFPSIGQGLAAASDGDTVLVAPGVYSGSENRDLDFEGRNLSVIASGGPDSTIMDCSWEGRAFYFDSGEDSTSLVSGFTIKNGSALYGGAIVCTPAAPTLTNLVIADCGDPGYVYGGGGLAFRGSSSRSLVEEVVLSGNEAIVGGAVYCGQGASPTIRNCTLVGNETSNVCAGIACSNASPTIERTIIAYSIAGESVWCEGSSVPATRHCLFFDNPAGDTPCGDAEENLFENPLLCDPVGSDLRLAPESPCLPENNAYGVLIGAIEEPGCTPPPCRTIRVPGDYPTISEALQFAAPCDTVLVAPGVYKESDLDVPWGVTCVSSGGPSVTTVDAFGGQSVFLFGFAGGSPSGSPETLLEGFTLTGATFSAIRVRYGSPSISDCVVTGNSAGYYGGGGGLRCDYNGDPVLKNVIFSDNSGASGGAVYCAENTNPSFSSTVFLRNSSDKGGAAACKLGSTPTFTNCTFADNEAELGGCVYSAGGTPTVVRCVLAFSRAGRPVTCGYGAEPVLSENVIYGNAHGDSLCGVHSENIFEDPQFCDLQGGDLRVGPQSPCLPENNPGGFLIGALSKGDCVPAGCSVLTVPGDYPTISEAASAAGFCDTILVAAGVYHESDIHVRWGTTLVGVSGADSTVIDAGGAETAMWIGQADGSPNRGLRGLIQGLTVRGCSGSALRVSGADMMLDGCVFESNTAVLGAALRADLADISVQDCRFEGNRATSTTLESGGGAVYCERGVLDFARCVFWSNTAERGGALYCATGSSVHIEQCTFAANSARWGAALFLNDSWLEMSESIIVLSPLGRVVHCTNGGDGLTERCLLYANSWGIEICGRSWDILVEEPGFCDEAGGDFRLCVDSPCLPENNPFGVQLGALGPGECPCPECSVLLVPSDYASIGDAIDQAVRCDTVLVEPGTYHEQDLVLPWGITVLSTSGPDVTIIDASGGGSVFLAGGEAGGRTLERASVRGFTLTGATDSAIRLVGRSPEISNCVFEGNSAMHGAAINCQNISSPIIVGTSFIGNTAERGGGAIYCAVGSSPRLTDVVFDGNEVTLNSSAVPGGGGMACYDHCSPKLDGCVFVGNRAAYKGGGFSCSEGGSPVLTDVTFEANDSKQGGGLYYESDVMGTISHAVFIENTAWYGGGIRLTDGSSPDFSFVTLSGNSADIRGGAVWAAGNSSFDRCTLTDNVGGRGAGFHFAGGSPLVTNTVIAYGTGLPVYRASGSPMVTKSVVFGHTQSDSLQGSHVSNLFADPQFCDREAGDFTVDATSVCVELNNPWGEAVGAWGVGCGGPVYYISADGSGAAPTIQAAVNACPNGGTIFMEPGEYSGTGNRDVNFDGKAITLAAISGPDVTFLDCEHEGRGFRFDSGEDTLSVVSGLTIRNGSRIAGGGILCDDSGPRIENCVIESCTADRGGGVACRGGARPVFEDVSVHWNDAAEGGGCYSTSNSDPVFRRCSFYENTAEEKGGAVYSNLGQMTLETVTIAGNHAAGHGAGVYLRYCPADLLGVIIAFNGQTEGIFSEGPYPPEFRLCDIYGNAGGDSLCGIVGYGNESVDPLFCDFFAGDLTLCENSPCIRTGPPEGHVGRHGVGCAACSATGVASNEEDDAGEPRLVSWASPNPARGEVRIGFSLSGQCEFALVRFYNLRGQLVRQLESGNTRAEWNRIVWDGRDENGVRLASGVYFYRMEACGMDDRGRLVLLR